jgi:hypothetical protein
MFPTVRNLRFFEANVKLCSCFGDVGAELIHADMSVCQLPEIKLDDFSFNTETANGYFED